MSQTHLTFGDASYPSAMTRSSPDALAGGKPWNWCPRIIGGPKCLGTSVSMFPPAIYASGRRPTGTLWWESSTPLPIPDNPWDMISVDFIVELPDSAGHNAVMVVVDSVTKQAHFKPTFMTVTAAGTACLFIQHVWKHHGLPRKVVSDRGPQFMVEFTRELYRMLGIKLAATTAYHPQGGRTDGTR